MSNKNNLELSDKFDSNTNGSEELVNGKLRIEDRLIMVMLANNSKETVEFEEARNKLMEKFHFPLVQGLGKIIFKEQWTQIYRNQQLQVEVIKDLSLTTLEHAILNASKFDDTKSKSQKPLYNWLLKIGFRKYQDLIKLNKLLRECIEFYSDEDQFAEYLSKRRDAYINSKPAEIIHQTREGDATDFVSQLSITDSVETFLSKCTDADRELLFAWGVAFNSDKKKIHIDKEVSARLTKELNCKPASLNTRRIRLLKELKKHIERDFSKGSSK